MKVAFLLVGQLRFKDRSHFDSFNDFIKGGDLFINTYDSYSSIASNIESDIIDLKLNDPSFSLANPIDKKILNSFPGQFNQWFLLTELTFSNINTLKDYDLVIKIRTDLSYNCDNFLNSVANFNSNCFYCFSDFFFYSNFDNFIFLFKDYWSKSVKPFIGKNDIYLPINYKNLLSSDLDSIRYRRFFYPYEFFPNPQDIIDSSIFKNIVHKNLDKLSTQSFDTKKVHCTWPYYTISPFSSEKFLALNVVNNFVSKSPGFNVSLMEGRHKFDFLKTS